MVICIMIRYYFDLKIYIWEHLEIKVGIKIIQYVYAYVISQFRETRLLYTVQCNVAGFSKIRYDLSEHLTFKLPVPRVK